MTPRTDRHWKTALNCSDAKFCRELENDLLEARELLQSLVSTAKGYYYSKEGKVPAKGAWPAMDLAEGFIASMADKDK